MAETLKGFARKRQPNAKEVLAAADLMEQRHRERIDTQKKSIDSFMAFLEQTDQVAAYVAWQNRNRKDES